MGGNSTKKTRRSARELDRRLKEALAPWMEALRVPSNSAARRGPKPFNSPSLMEFLKRLDPAQEGEAGGTNERWRGIYDLVRGWRRSADEGTWPVGRADGIRRFCKATGYSADRLLGFEDVPALRTERAVVGTLGDEIAKLMRERMLAPGPPEAGAWYFVGEWPQEQREMLLAEVGSGAGLGSLAQELLLEHASLSLRDRLVRCCEAVKAELWNRSRIENRTAVEGEEYDSLLRNFAEHLSREQERLQRYPDDRMMESELFEVARRGIPICVDRDRQAFEMSYQRWPPVRHDLFWRTAAGRYLGPSIPAAALSIVWRDRDGDYRILAPWSGGAARFEQAPPGSWIATESTKE